jgi:NADPH:quinone reductase-like Zn-dependent oxidoreductase
MTERMRAISQDTLGGPEVLTLIETDRPEPGPTEILVRVHAASVNPTDWKARADGGFYGAPPFILGRDISGVVESIGYGVTLFEPGDQVFGMPRFPEQTAAYAEYVTGPSHHFAHKPTELDHIAAAALPLAGLTAWQALVETAQLTTGQRVLIHAAAGGVGHLAVQIAKARGAYVIGTASAAKHDLLRSLGADELVDYRTTDFTDRVRDVDVVLDPITGGYTSRSLPCLRDGGVYVSILQYAPAAEPEAERRGIRMANLLVEPDSAGMRALAQMAATGKLHAEIDAVLPLAEAAKAHQLGETNRITGKVVLTV